MKSAETNESAIVEKPRDTNKDDKMEKCEVDAEWDDPTTLELEELLSSSLSTAFTNAVKKVVGCGYSKETAEWAILSSSNFNGHKDAESNIVEGALALLKMNEHMKMPKKSVFEGLQSLVEYTLLEMIHVVWELRPDLMVTEVMWCLLVSDLQLATACGLRRGPESAGGSPGQPSGTGQSNCGKSNSLMTGNSSEIYHSDISSVRPAQYQKPNPGGLGKEANLSLQELKDRFSGIADMDKKPKALAIHLKKDLLRQKAIHFEKNYRGRFTKGSFKAKVAAWGSMVLDKSLKSQSGVAMMENYSRLSISEGKEKNPGNPQLADKVPLSAFPAGNTDTHMRDEKVNFTEPPTSKEQTSYCAQSTFDGILQEYVGKDEKSQFLMMIAPLKAELEKELQGWYDWANEKVMQATRKLGKEQAELKTLRREKEDIEKSKKEKQILEESTAKRQAELDHAMVKAIGQNELANCTVKRLEAANNVLRKEMEDARMEARGSAVNLDEAVEKEQEMMKKLQAWKLENTLMTEKLTIARQEHTELESQIGKVKNRQNQFKLLLRQEEKENLKAQRLIDFLRGEREKVEAQTKAEANSINQTAQMKKQKLEESIKNLRTIISELKQESDKKKIADLNVGYGPNDGKRLAVCEEIFGTGGVKEERECVVCMNDEISVLFLPCAHLVLCGPCNARHEKQGMKDCPSCRGTIEKRVSLNFRE